MLRFPLLMITLIHRRIKSSRKASSSRMHITKMHTRTTIIRTIITGTGQLQALCHVILYLQFVFSFLTCGIYSIYWMIKLNDEVNQLAGEPQATSGGMVFLFSLITCGIYGIYWAYKMGERCDRIRGIQGNSSILYLVLSILGLDIVYFCLLQDMINKEVS